MSIFLKTLALTKDGNAFHGSLYFRKNYEMAVSPLFDVEHHPDSPVGVLVPQKLELEIFVYAEIFNDGNEAVDAVITAEETSLPHLLGNVSFPLTRFHAHAVTWVKGKIKTNYLRNFNTSMQKVEKQTWRWKYKIVGRKAVDLKDTTADIYLLPELPVEAYGRVNSLWDLTPGNYNPANFRYIWTDLLDVCDHACDLYNIDVLHHRPATQSEHLEAFVYELNQNAAFHYDVWSGASAYTLRDQNGDITVKLKSYLRDRAAPYWNYLNCIDCAAITAIEALACGYKIYTGFMNGPQGTGFLCNPIIAIGTTVWEKPFNGGFRFHAVAVATAICNKATQVYDACLMLDDGEKPSQMDEEKRPVLPLGMTFTDSDLPNVNVPPSVRYEKKIYRERLVAHASCCNMNNSAYCVRNITDIFFALPMGGDEEEFAALTPVMRRYRLTENPLPENIEKDGTSCKNFEGLPELPGVHALGRWTLKEDNGAQRVYSLIRDQKGYEVSFLKTQSREEAWLRLITRLSCISHPGVESVRLGDCGFGIDGHWRLFVYQNTLIEVASPGYDVASLAPALLAAFE